MKYKSFVCISSSGKYLFFIMLPPHFLRNYQLRFRFQKFLPAPASLPGGFPIPFAPVLTGNDPFVDFASQFFNSWVTVCLSSLTCFAVLRFSGNDTLGTNCKNRKNDFLRKKRLSQRIAASTIDRTISIT